MLIKKVDKNAAFNRANERRQKAHDLLLKMYEDGHSCFSIEDFEDEYTTLASLRNYLNDESFAISKEILREKGFKNSEIRFLRFHGYRKLMNVFIIRKVSCKAVLVVDIKPFSDELLENFKKVIAENR